MKEYCADPAFMVAIAMTEPESGGDNILPYDAEGAGVRTTAVPDGDDYVINGRKQFIAHAGIARLYVVFTRTDPSKGMSEGCTSFLIPAGHPGMRFGRVHDKMGFRLLRNQEIVFENCRVPKEWMLGPPHGGLASMRAGLRSDGILQRRPLPRGGEAGLGGDCRLVQGAHPGRKARHRAPGHRLRAGRYARHPPGDAGARLERGLVGRS